MCIVTFCFAQEETTYINAHEEVHLYGPFNINELEEDSLYAHGLKKQYNEFKSDDATYSWSSELKDVEVDIYMGTWCRDSKKWIPSFLKAWGKLGLDRKKLKYTVLYDTDERYK